MTEHRTPWYVTSYHRDDAYWYIYDAEAKFVAKVATQKLADHIVAAANAIPACEDALRRVDEEGIDDLTLNLIVKARTMLEACHANDTNRIG